MKHHVLHLGLLGVIAVACFFAHPLTGRAGDAKPDVLLVNMTPDEKSTERSRDCVQAVASRLRSVDGYTIVHRQGETPTREAAGMTADEPFMEWPAGAFGRLEELEFRSENGPRTKPQTVLLIDCRPEEQHLDIRMSRGTLLEVRGSDFDGRFLLMVYAILRQHIWHTF